MEDTARFIGAAWATPYGKMTHLEVNGEEKPITNNAIGDSLLFNFKEEGLQYGNNKFYFVSADTCTIQKYTSVIRR